MKTLQAKATDFCRRLLRAICDGHYFHLLYLLVRTDLSQQIYGSATMVPSSYTYNIYYLSLRIYQLYHSASVYIDYIRTCPQVLHALGPRTYIIHIHLSAVV